MDKFGDHIPFSIPGSVRIGLRAIVHLGRIEEIGVVTPFAHYAPPERRAVS